MQIIHPADTGSQDNANGASCHAEHQVAETQSTPKVSRCYTASKQGVCVTCCLNLRPEVLHRVQIGQVDPLPVGGRAVIPILLHVQAIQAHVHAIHALEQ